MRVAIAVCGASGSVYADRLLAELIPRTERTYVIASTTGEQVVRHELDRESSVLRQVLAKSKPMPDNVRLCRPDDLFSPLASGSSCPHALVVVPASMGLVGRLAAGVSASLIERAADVQLKQRRQLLICPRETPLNLIHLRNLTTLAEAGATIVPLMPGFYNRPETIGDLVDFQVGRLLELLGLSHDLYKPWNSRML